MVVHFLIISVCVCVKLEKKSGQFEVFVKLRNPSIRELLLQLLNFIISLLRSKMSIDTHEGATTDHTRICIFIKCDFTKIKK